MKTVKKEFEIDKCFEELAYILYCEKRRTVRGAQLAYIKRKMKGWLGIDNKKLVFGFKIDDFS